jgi:hypothetical protein
MLAVPVLAPLWDLPVYAALSTYSLLGIGARQGLRLLTAKEFEQARAADLP